MIQEKIIPHLCKNALVTDVGSVKKNICQVAENLFKNETASFIDPLQWQVLKNQV